MMDHARLLGEKSGGKDGQRGILGSADFDGSGKFPAAVYENFIHE
jgi:hypothetical protein